VRIIVSLLLISICISSVPVLVAGNPSPGSYHVIYDRRGGETNLKIKLQNDSLHSVNYTLNAYDMRNCALEEDYVAGNVSWIKSVDSDVQVLPKSSKEANIRLVLPLGVSPGKYELGVEVKDAGVCIILVEVVGRVSKSSSFPIWIIPIIAGILAIVVLVIWKMKKSGGA